MANLSFVVHDRCRCYADSVAERGSQETVPTREAAFGTRLRWLREAAGLTQEELASRAGLSAKAISLLERGERRRPHPHTIRSLAEAMGLSENERTALLAAVPRQGDEVTTALASVPGFNLPTPSTPLLGRERELGEVRAYLQEARLLTLSGPGGVGKTRLALEAAREATEFFPDGVVFVALAPLSDAALVVPTIARSLGLREAKGQTPREVLHAHLREKRLLLMLDNFEHVLEVVPEVVELTESCPNLTVLTTSRAPLRARGEQEYAVQPLELPTSTKSPAAQEVLGSPSGRLFVERARATSANFRLEEGNAAAVAAICWRLAGLPLALELAAAKVRFLDPTALLSRLDWALSAGWARDLPDRQRTMRATLDWSHGLLEEPERILLRRLSVFAGTFSLTAAETVGAAGEVEAEEVLELLGRLVEQSLVTAEVGGNEEARYGMLEPVRQYARERLEESGDADETRRRHAMFFLQLSEYAAPELTRAEQAAWLERLGREHENLRAALSWLLGRGDIKDAARLGWDLKWFWYIRGHLAEGRRWMERTLAHEDALLPVDRAKATTVAAALASAQGELDQHASLSKESIRLAREAGDQEVLAMATYLGAHAAVGRGEHARAAALADESVALYRALGDQSGAGLALTVPVYIALTDGDFSHAERFLDESEELLRSVGSWWHLTVTLIIRATVTQMRSEHARTIVLLRESLALAPRLHDTQAIAYGLEGLAGALAMLGGQERRAARLLGAAEALRERTGSAIAMPPWRELYQRHLAALRTRLDADELAAAWAEGRALTPDEAVAEALAESE